MAGAMSWVSERGFVAAVSNAGGFGVIACGSMGPAQLAEEIAGIRRKRRDLRDRPKGVNGRNSDNRMIFAELGWEPSIRLRDGLERTYRWIHDEYAAKHG